MITLIAQCQGYLLENFHVHCKVKRKAEQKRLSRIRHRKPETEAFLKEMFKIIFPCITNCKAALMFLHHLPYLIKATREAESYPVTFAMALQIYNQRQQCF